MFAWLKTIGRKIDAWANPPLEDVPFRTSPPLENIVGDGTVRVYERPPAQIDPTTFRPFLVAPVPTGPAKENVNPPAPAGDPPPAPPPRPIAMKAKKHTPKKRGGK